MRKKTKHPQPTNTGFNAWQSLQNGSNLECPDLDFVYNDTDTHPNEIAELYSYTEQSEFHLNVKVRKSARIPRSHASLCCCLLHFAFLPQIQAFEEQMAYYKLLPSWQKLTETQRRDVILKLLDQLDLSKKNLRMQAARTILYLAQGCFCEVQSDHEQQEWTRENVKLLYNMGIFAVFVELLNFEIEYVFCTVEAKRFVHGSFYISHAEIRVQQTLRCERWPFHWPIRWICV